MSPAKKKSAPASPPRLAKLASLFAGWGKYLLIVILVAGGVAFGGYKIWQSVGGRVLSSDEYLLTPEKIQLSPWPMPNWVRPDPRADVFDQLRRRGPVSIMDDNIHERVTAAFQQNPWIAKVHQVVKEYPATIKVQVDYRVPVLMVQVETEAYAVDAEGTSLPTLGCFTPVEAAKYPRLTGVDAAPKTGLGKRWADSRVIGGAEIAAVLMPVWEKMRLKRIMPRSISSNIAGVSASPTQSPRFAEYDFEITVQDENGKESEKRIFWGRSPSDKNTESVTPAQKVKKLEKLLGEFGSLDKCTTEINLARP